MSAASDGAARESEPGRLAFMNRWVSGEWAIEKTQAIDRRVVHYWLTIFWLTIGAAIWFILRDVLWFVGFMSLYAIVIAHLSAWAAETPVESE